MKTNISKWIAAVTVCAAAVVMESCCKDNPEIISEPDSSRTIQIRGTGMHASKNTVKNGETISLTTDVTGTIGGKAVLFTVTYFCDDSEIGMSTDSTSNYRIDYLIKDMSLGQHSLKSHAVCDNTTYNYTTPIIVTE